MTSVPGAVATGSQHFKGALSRVQNPVATAPGTDLIPTRHSSSRDLHLIHQHTSAMLVSFSARVAQQSKLFR